MGLLVRKTSGESITGLTFPSNGSGSVRFHFGSPPAVRPLTILWKVHPIQQTGYYTTFFWGHEGGEVVFADPEGGYYFGCHPYPQGGAEGTVHNWEIAIQQDDEIVDENANNTTVTKGQWYSQAAVATEDTANELLVSFYWDLGTGLTRLIAYDTAVEVGNDYLVGASPNGEPDDPGLFFGDAPWSESNEMLSGHFRGLIIVAAALSTTHIDALRQLESNADVISYCTNNSITLWYCNMNPTPDDISDKSGAGHNPTWANANRPTLWTPQMPPSVNASGRTSSASAANTLTLSGFAAAAGSNRFLEVWCGIGTGGTPAAPTSVTWGGNALTIRGTALTDGPFSVSKWRMVEASFPGGASGDIVATWADSHDERAIMALVTQDVNQSSPYRNAAQVAENDQGTSTPSVTVTSNAADLVTCGIWCGDLSGALTAIAATAGTEVTGCDTGAIATGFEYGTAATVAGSSPTITFDVDAGAGDPDETMMMADSLQEAAAGGAAISIVPLIQNYRNMGLMQ